MSGHLRILHLEDDRDYSDLVKSLLEKEGYGTDIVLATTRGEFEEALDAKCFDVILADYLLPDYDGIEALQQRGAQAINGGLAVKRSVGVRGTREKGQRPQAT